MYHWNQNLPGCATGSPHLTAAWGNCTVKLRTGPELSIKFSCRCADRKRLPVYISEVSDGPLTKGVVSVVPESPNKKETPKFNFR